MEIRIKEGTRVSIYGLGHMGLPTAALLAKSGLNVWGADINPQTVETINKGSSPIMEPGLDELVGKTVKSGLFSATTNLKAASMNSKVHMVIVPTPVDENKISDLRAVENACKSISQGLKKSDLVIIESTVPPGTCSNLAIPLLEKSGLKAGKDFGVAYTPERALPNNTIYEMTHNPRVIGGINEWSIEMASSLYERITSGKIIKVRDLLTAEMVKLMENTYRDTNIALANEFALICESLGIDAREAINAANHHPRVNIHTPGPGVGGHCLSIDPYFLVEIAQKQGTDAPLIKASRMVNEKMPLEVARMTIESLKEKSKDVGSSEVGILGVAYKGNVADARETPAKPLIEKLKSVGATVYVHDPYVSSETIKSFGAIPVNMKRALECDCVVLVTDHDVYSQIKPVMIKKGLLICTRPILDPEPFLTAGVTFKGVGMS
ncbi:MAG TPA: nucleotide sugar dehydrogenase [Methanobacteriaceae archaeon]|nr:nucleotide sugar dehydrogenase [Methanobacteriaceae archaeon]